MAIKVRRVREFDEPYILVQTSQEIECVAQRTGLDLSGAGLLFILLDTSGTEIEEVWSCESIVPWGDRLVYQEL